MYVTGYFEVKIWKYALQKFCNLEVDKATTCCLTIHLTHLIKNPKSPFKKRTKCAMCKSKLADKQNMAFRSKIGAEYQTLDKSFMFAKSKLRTKSKKSAKIKMAAKTSTKS